MDASHDIKVLFIIVNAGFAEFAVDIARARGAGGATILNARGLGSIHKSIMGITVDTEREIVLILVGEEKVGGILAAIKEKAGPGSPCNALCFVMPVEKMMGTNTAPQV